MVDNIFEISFSQRNSYAKNEKIKNSASDLFDLRFYDETERYKPLHTKYLEEDRKKDVITPPYAKDPYNIPYTPTSKKYVTEEKPTKTNKPIQPVLPV